MTSYVINRDDRPERLRNVTEEFKKVNINPRVFHAIIGKPGWIGCAKSHIAVIEECRNERYFQIFEDDVVFLKDFSAVSELAYSQLPLDWYCLYYGVSPLEPQIKYSDNLFRVNHAYCTHAILWNNRPNGAIEFILNNKSKIRKYDVFLAEQIQPRFNCFVTYPMICTQRQYKSDTCTRSDVSVILHNFERFCK